MYLEKVNTKLVFVLLNLLINGLCKISLPNLICMSLVISAFYGASKFSFGLKFLLGVLVGTIFPLASNSTPKGLCIKNEAGFFNIACTTWSNQPLSIFEGEVVDHLLALWWFQGIIVSMDCKIVVNKLRVSFAGHSELGSIIKECRSLLSYLQNFYFVPRQTNAVANSLARVVASHASLFDYHIIP
ncbi:hypothetical protein GmHk_15G044819 [Glycine max]|nr:hypothetical protein GmHk_15G044819 [Glycine max]